MACSDGQQLYRRLESDFNSARALPVARAALGLMVVLRCWVEAGNAGRVALSANICHDVVAAVLGAGCEPIFCDIDPACGNVLEQEWARARAAGASAALVVHLYGNPADISVVRRHFSSSDCLIIDDAAQALGSSNAAGLVGGQGDVGLLSFGVAKHIEAGGAAILFSDSAFADTVAHTLASIEILPELQRSAIYTRFRQRLEAARARLRSEGETAAVAFHGLLDGYSPSLQVPFPVGAAHTACLAFEIYPQARELRMQKSAAWAAGLEDSSLVPVGMGTGTVPWRYTCRLPGIDWNWQHRLGEEMRSHGLNVSHWYLPAHWMCGYEPQTLPGTERLAREVFQFWVDGHTSLETIEHGAAAVSAITRSFSKKAGDR
jgi:dTDP-4-amino-4,6-dideoxygalactose transaminase